MSVFTDTEHLLILNETTSLQNAKLDNPRDLYRMGCLQYRLKDYNKACCYFSRAAEQEYIPAMYDLARCMQNKEGAARDTVMEERLFERAYEYYRSMDGEYGEEGERICRHRLAMCYAYGYGTDCREEEALALFSSDSQFGPSVFEMGLACEEGRLGFFKDAQRAGSFYRKAYDLNYEEAIFRHYSLFDGEFKEYPCQREIIEAYGFRLGQLMRLVTVSPCRDSYTKMAEFYENGFPGDTGEEVLRFREKAREYRKKAAESREEQTFGKFVVFPDSELYRTYIS